MFTKAKLVYLAEIALVLFVTLFILSKFTSSRQGQKYINKVYMYGSQKVSIINNNENLIVGDVSKAINVKKGDKFASTTAEPAILMPSKPLCSPKGEKLIGPMYIDQTIPDNNTLKALSVDFGGSVEPGGWWSPSTCIPRRKVAVIIPFRKREIQLKIFLHHLHPMLQRQQLFYRIIVVEQLGDTPFNRASLFNVGYAEAIKISPFDCFIFTDVDLLPEDDRNYYGCPTSPRHMSVAVDKFDYKLPYKTIFGGIGAFLKADFEKINGMSNLFWGWGGEDDDLYGRVKKKGLKLTRPSMKHGRYTMIQIKHHRSHGGNPNRRNLLRNTGSRMVTDGINGLKYHLDKVEERPLVTFVKVNMSPKDYCIELGEC